MFGNFIYFIVVLLIYTTYQPAAEGQIHALGALLSFCSLTLLFALVVKSRFARLEKQLFRLPFARLDHQFTALLNRLSILAIGLFAVDIYFLDLPSLFTGIWPFAALPTLTALIFLSVFLGYLAIIWALAYPLYRALYTITVSRRSYVGSNISFAIPVILPWVLLSLISDLIRILPFEPAHRFLSTTEGEALFILLFLLIVALAGPLLIQKIWRCKPMPPGYERFRIEALCRRAGMEYADILYWPIFGGRMITAGVMGLVRRFRYILVTDALLSVLSPEEVDAVIAHEIGHVKRRHLIFYLFFFVGYMLISYATFDLILYGFIYLEPFYRPLMPPGMDQATVISVLLSVFIIGVFLIYFRFIFGYFMRNFERQADIFVYQLFASARPLITTFEKITQTSGQPPEKPNWHHYSISERIDYLIKCETDRSWIHRHDRKVRVSVLLYSVAILMMAGVGYHLNFGETGRRLNTHLFERILVHEIEKDQGNAQLHRMLGDLLYHRQNLAGAAGAYERAIALNPDEATALNNLAWLYATSDAAALRNPERALALARRAAELDPAPHVLDTLAESYFVNGMHEAAAEAGERALQRAEERGEDAAYFREQLEKFRRAARGGNPNSATLNGQGRVSRQQPQTARTV